MSLKRPFKFGKIILSSNIFYAPLAGCSDFPFRKMSSQYKPGLMYCEMVKMDALIRDNTHTFRYLEYEEGMRPIGAQLCGSKKELAAPCAKILEDLGFDVIDLNCGCPVDKVTKDGSGSGLLKNPEKIGEIISEMVSAVNIPVTVKIRVGWDENSIVAPLITKIAEEAGATAICIHGRTREQGYVGPANWDHIKSCKGVAKNIIVIGNGDLFDPMAVEKMFAYTGCDAVLLSRGTMGSPWLADDVYRYLSQQEPLKRDSKSALLEHYNYIKAFQSDERKCVFDMRRVGCWFLRGHTGMRQLRETINQTKSVSEIMNLVELASFVD